MSEFKVIHMSHKPIFVGSIPEKIVKKDVTKSQTRIKQNFGAHKFLAVQENSKSD